MPIGIANQERRKHASGLLICVRESIHGSVRQVVGLGARHVWNRECESPRHFGSWRNTLVCCASFRDKKNMFTLAKFQTRSAPSQRLGTCCLSAAVRLHLRLATSVALNWPLRWTLVERHSLVLRCAIVIPLPSHRQDKHADYKSSLLSLIVEEKESQKDSIFVSS